MAMKLRVPLFSAMAFVLLAGMTGGVYAGDGRSPAPTCTEGRLDLQIKDQNEPWKDGVYGTWVANNMAPGDLLTFDGSFVGLRSDDRGRLTIACEYLVSEESPASTSDADPQTPLHPDAMAKELVIASCFYNFGGWQIDCLTGELSGASAAERRTFNDCPGKRWRIQDANGDGRVTFYDLKALPLASVPLPKGTQGARFVMSVRFAGTAGNGLQGDTFNLTMRYTLKPW
jgi:hypothetical protein